MPEATEMCSKCKEHPRADPESSNPWCKPCRAKYQQEYREVQLTMAEGKGFVKGVEALRHVLVTEFLGQGGGRFSGYECADLIQQAPGPRVSD